MQTDSEEWAARPPRRVGVAWAALAAFLGFAAADSWQPPPKQILAGAAIATVDVYRATLSVVFSKTRIVGCRFQPTCSVYAREALTRYGIPKGLLLATGRVLRCNPFAKGGADPVP